MKIRFRYSWIYDEKHRSSPLIQERLRSQGKKYPSTKKVSNYIKTIEQLWRKEERKILSEISKISGLIWKEKEIICYVVGHAGCFSDPLTMKLFENKTDFIDTLTHELIHQIQTQNQKINKKWKEYVQKKYKDESIMTQNHIALHAIHYKLYLKLFSKNRLKRDMNFSKKVKAEDYIRSWQIVEEKGAENIIKKFHEVTK